MGDACKGCEEIKAYVPFLIPNIQPHVYTVFKTDDAREVVSDHFYAPYRRYALRHPRLCL